jgi:hypothetical protein
VDELPEESDLRIGFPSTLRAPWVESLENLGTKTRRKDSRGKRDYHRSKKDRHKTTSTVAVRLPFEQVEQMRTAAEAHGLSLSAWLAAVIQHELASGTPPYGGIPRE